MANDDGRPEGADGTKKLVAEGRGFLTDLVSGMDNGRCMLQNS